MLPFARRHRLRHGISGLGIGGQPHANLVVVDLVPAPSSLRARPRWSAAILGVCARSSGMPSQQKVDHQIAHVEHASLRVEVHAAVAHAREQEGRSRVADHFCLGRWP